MPRPFSLYLTVYVLQSYPPPPRHVTPERLSPEERVRNRVGHVLRFEALPPAAPRPPGPQEFCASTLPGDDRWPPVLHCNTRLTKLPPPPALHPDQPGGRWGAWLGSGRTSRPPP